MKSVYITQSCAVSPQNSLSVPALQPIVIPAETMWRCIEPPYGDMMTPMQLRRLSRIIKIAVYCGMRCLGQAQLQCPDGIIIGTGKGNLSETEKFLKASEYDEDRALNPTPFILSTYNAVNGAIALQTGATGYNQTYVHGGNSLEIALLDAQVQLQHRGARSQLLVGCFDEITSEYFAIKNKHRYWKKAFAPDVDLRFQTDTPGTIAGEGAAFFTMTNQPQPSALELIEIAAMPQLSPEEVEAAVVNHLSHAAWPLQSVGMLALGMNGDPADEAYYRPLIALFPPDIPILGYKHLCGEYETAGGFGLWLLSQLASGAPIPEVVWYRKPSAAARPLRILYYNHFRGIHHNLILMKTTD